MQEHYGVNDCDRDQKKKSQKLFGMIIIMHHMTFGWQTFFPT